MSTAAVKVSVTAVTDALRATLHEVCARIETLEADLGHARAWEAKLAAAIAAVETGDVAAPTTTNGSGVVKGPDPDAGDHPPAPPALSPPGSGPLSTPAKRRRPGTSRAVVLAALPADGSWTSASDVRAATGLSRDAARDALQDLVHGGDVQATGATKARRYRLRNPRTTSPAGTGPEQPEPQAGRPTTPDPEIPSSVPEPPPSDEAATPAGEDPAPAAPRPRAPAPPVSARVRRELEREQLPAEPTPPPVKAGTALAATPLGRLVGDILKELATEPEPVPAKVVARQLMRNQHEIAAALRELARTGHVVETRADGQTLYHRVAEDTGA